jgi:SAM-dependent methyltransferase
MPEIDFIERIHTATPRNYLLRVTEADKAACATKAKAFGRDYFDGERTCGYGGYRYDGRWRPVAERLIEHYGLKAGDRVLDVGCAKGFLVYDLQQALPGLEVEGVDVSQYAIEHAMPEVQTQLRVANAVSLPFEDGSFDLVLGINVLHNLRLYDLERALKEIQRVTRRGAYIVNDAYRNEREKVNLMYWQLTCECFFTPQEWEWLFDRCGYRGDYGFIYFE